MRIIGWLLDCRMVGGTLTLDVDASICLIRADSTGATHGFATFYREGRVRVLFRLRHQSTGVPVCGIILCSRHAVLRDSPLPMHLLLLGGIGAR